STQAGSAPCIAHPNKDSDPTPRYPDCCCPPDTTALRDQCGGRSSRSAYALPSTNPAHRKQSRCTKACEAGRREVDGMAKQKIRQRVIRRVISPLIKLESSLSEPVVGIPRAFGLLVAAMGPEETEFQRMSSFHPGKIVGNRGNALQRPKRSALKIA